MAKPQKKKLTKKEILHKQLTQIKPLFNEQVQPVIAYEPIWAIGSGNTPTKEELVSTCETIKKICLPARPKVLYGGSVDKDLAQSYCEFVDGYLIGSASKDVEQLKKIILSC